MAKKTKEVSEETVSAATLHPAAQSLPGTEFRTSKLSAVLGKLANIDDESLTKIYDEVMAKAAELGHGPGVGDVAMSNQATINMKSSDAVPGGAPNAKHQDPMNTSIAKDTAHGTHVYHADPINTSISKSVKEDLDGIFSGTELSEEFKDKTATLFEAAVNARVAATIVEAEELLIQEVEEFKEEFVTELTEKLDSYLNYVTETWLTENEVQVTNSLRAEMTESFIEGLKGLFAQHYVEIPDDKVDVVETLSAQLEELEAKLDAMITENASLKEMNQDAILEVAFDEVAEGLVMTQAEKFKVLSEGISFDGTVEDYKKKLTIIKEKHFPINSANQTLTEEVDGSAGDVNETLVASGPMKRYAQAISNTVKR